MEYLSRIMIQEIRQSNWSPISITRKGLQISHTLFANNMFLFAEASIKNASTISNVLNKFFCTNGLSMNKSKSKIFFSNNSNDKPCNQISNKLTIKRVNNLGKYLGFPIQTKHSNFNQIISKLSSWNAKFLTMASRATLAKLVLFAIPIHTMQCFNLPSKTTETINKIIIDFI